MEMREKVREIEEHTQTHTHTHLLPSSVWSSNEKNYSKRFNNIVYVSILWKLDQCHSHFVCYECCEKFLRTLSSPHTHTHTHLDIIYLYIKFWHYISRKKMVCIVFIIWILCSLCRIYTMCCGNRQPVSTDARVSWMCLMKWL